MSKRKIFITWQPVLTDHQAYTYEALAEESRCKLLAHVISYEDKFRQSQGWLDTVVTSVERRLIPKNRFLRYCYKQLRDNRNEIHIFASPFQNFQLILCIFMAKCLRIDFYIISEPHSPGVEGYLKDTSIWIGLFKSILRPWLYRFYVFILGNCLTGVFAISKLAEEQYQQAGVNPSKIFPFGYFVPYNGFSSYQSKMIPENKTIKLRMVFIASLIRRKGIDLLIDAIQSLSNEGFHVSLDIYGPGDQTLIATTSKNILYKGVVPFGQAQQVIADYDLLVLPSRFDGWGVVVNESICAGVPVVTSDKVGAGVTVESMGGGLCFQSGNIDALKNLLSELINKPELLLAMRQKTKRVADLLQPKVAGHYMFEVISKKNQAKKLVKNPWCENGNKI